MWKRCDNNGTDIYRVEPPNLHIDRYHLWEMEYTRSALAVDAVTAAMVVVVLLIFQKKTGIQNMLNFYDNNAPF